MNSKKRFCLICLLLGVSFLFYPQGWTQATPETKKPVITNAFAVQEIRERTCGQARYYGSNWKIYIEAEDPDGEIAKIVVMASRVGYGQLATNWIYLRPQYGNYLKGYLEWNTFDSTDRAEVTLEISIVDSTGNVSKEAVFRLTCESGDMDHSRPGCLLDPSGLPPPFDQENIVRIGYLDIDLLSQNY